jgi:2-polyprenyl-6-hydroxyphenyl methylase/3-demethylubiquinone-9 3-methyltransferase
VASHGTFVELRVRMPAPATSIGQSTDAPFPFGENWKRFLATVDEPRISAASASMERMLGPHGLAGRRFLDAGCGSGLFSLAANRLGALVVSFDVDPQCVACTQELKQRFAPDPAGWQVHCGSVLDPAFLAGLGEFDAVYSWGVLHHTGAMWDAIELVQQRVAPGGLLWLAIYNDQGVTSRIWRRIKRGYNALPLPLRTPYVVAVGGAWLAWRAACRLTSVVAATGWRLVSRREPLAPAGALYRDVFRSQRSRGMHWWYDLVDWIGGWPFEVAAPEQVFRFLRDRGFELRELTTCGGGLGCNEFVFRRRA